MLRMKIRRSIQAASAIGVMISLRINGQKNIPKRRMIIIKRTEMTTRLENFISVPLLHFTTVQHDGVQTVDCFLFIDRVRLPIAVPRGFKKPG